MPNPILRKTYLNHVGNCPKCGHLIDVLVAYDHDREPSSLKGNDLGAIHCGDCFVLLVWSSNIPLRLASPAETQFFIDQMGGPDKYAELLRRVKDNAAMQQGMN